MAATLLDLKVAGLLPQGELVDAEDVALLEARDLLFARLLQYRAFKEAAAWFAARLDAESTRHVRSVRLEEKYRQQTPELVWTLTRDDFAALAAWPSRRARSRSSGWTTCTRRWSASGSRPPTSSRCCGRGGPVDLPAADRRSGAEGRGDRALPRRARALPRTPRSRSSSSNRSASSRCAGPPSTGTTTASPTWEPTMTLTLPSERGSGATIGRRRPAVDRRRRRALEAILMVADEPQCLVSLATALECSRAGRSAVDRAPRRRLRRRDGRTAARLRAARGRRRLAALRARRLRRARARLRAHPEPDASCRRPRSRRSP